jgi:signal transduction histidine kinase
VVAHGAATERFELLLRRMASIALTATSLEVIFNFYRDLAFLNLLIALPALSLLLASFIAIFISSFAGRARSTWFALHAALVVIVLVFWPLQLIPGAALPVDSQPWVWWALGMASVCAAIAWPTWAAITYIFATPLLWFWVRFGDAVTNANVDDLARDVAYAMLFPAVLAALIWLLRNEVNKVDDAGAQAVNNAIEQARTDAAERERQRLDALVHDSVLHTLLSATVAETDRERRAASELARQTLNRLSELDSEPEEPAAVSAHGLVGSLRKACLRLDPSLEVTVSGSSAATVAESVAEAITTATIQAVENALQHAEAARIKVALKIHDETGTLTVEVSDNGRGFRLSRVDRNRIGIQTSIVGRMRAVGGRAEISSEIGRGTKVRLEWQP